MNAPKKSPRRLIVSPPLHKGRRGGMHLHLTLECGHQYSHRFPDEVFKTAKTIQCWKCRDGHCVKHDWVEIEDPDNPNALRCTKCPAVS